MDEVVALIHCCLRILKGMVVINASSLTKNLYRSTQRRPSSLSPHLDNKEKNLAVPTADSETMNHWITFLWPE